LFVVFFLHTYSTPDTLDIHLTSPQKFMFGGVAFAVMYLNIVWVPKIFHFGFLDPTRWTVKKVYSSYVVDLHHDCPGQYDH
jgi:hypothetical protein